MTVKGSVQPVGMFTYDVDPDRLEPPAPDAAAPTRAEKIQSLQARQRG